MMGKGGEILPPNGEVWYQADAAITPYTTTQILRHWFVNGLGKIKSTVDPITTLQQWFRERAVKKVMMLNTVTSISNNAFSNCTSLKQVTGLENVTSIGSSAFVSTSELVEEFNLPNLMTIGTGAFSFSGIKSITAPRLQSLANGSTYTGIFGYSQITEAHFEDLETIGNYTFSECKKLKAISLGPTIPTVGTAAFSGVTLEHIYVPADKVEAYKADTFWSQYANIIEANPNE